MGVESKRSGIVVNTGRNQITPEARAEIGMRLICAYVDFRAYCLARSSCVGCLFRAQENGRAVCSMIKASEILETAAESFRDILDDLDAQRAPHE